MIIFAVLSRHARAAEYLEVCEREGVDPVTASRAHIGVFVRVLTERPSRRGANVIATPTTNTDRTASSGRRLDSDHFPIPAPAPLE
ncbi:hypothetical protein ACIBQX_13380 [Nonomuraea sp. NPDC049714]|uniref:hypothetical protein n=1 Tax=Nonomuraea sp. NPDC049714 TaxID=3364357 RepID=UPI0037B77B8E